MVTLLVRPAVQSLGSSLVRLPGYQELMPGETAEASRMQAEALKPGWPIAKTVYGGKHATIIQKNDQKSWSSDQ